MSKKLRQLNVDVEEELLIKAKIEAIRRGISLKSLVEAAIRKELKA
jgi:predicted HicB family RNase H-like nuclease